MNVKRASLCGVVVALAVSACVLAVATAQVRPKPAKLCPITFHLDPSTLQAGYAKQIEMTNARLAQDFVDLRGDRTFMSGKVPEGLASKFAGDYKGTYLAFPVLWDDKGGTHMGWGEVLAYLATVLPKSTFIQPQAVNVYMEYVPLKDRTDTYFKAKLAATLGKRGGSLWFKPGDIDFLASIRTVLAWAPYDDPIEIGNEDPSPHQNVCDPIF